MVARGDRPETLGASLWRALLGLPVDVDDSEARAVAVEPLEVVEQAPCVIPANVDPIFDDPLPRPVNKELGARSHSVGLVETSDDFFSKLRQNEILSDTIKFDVIFIDGLHLAEQVDRDIINALDIIKEDGFVVLHDCNPPTEWHARETFNYHFSPAGGYWNGTTWKAFMKWRFNADIHSCCIDSDSGVGILSKKQAIGDSTDTKNLFFEFSELDKHRKEYLNLISFDELKKILE